MFLFWRAIFRIIYKPWSKILVCDILSLYNLKISNMLWTPSIESANATECFYLQLTLWDAQLRRKWNDGTISSPRAKNAPWRELSISISKKNVCFSCIGRQKTASCIASTLNLAKIICQSPWTYPNRDFFARNTRRHDILFSIIWSYSNYAFQFLVTEHACFELFCCTNTVFAAKCVGILTKWEGQHKTSSHIQSFKCANTNRWNQWKMRSAVSNA